jgi:hypothetical protein
VLLPTLDVIERICDVIERICAEAVTRANRRIFKALTDSLSVIHHQHLNNLLKRKNDSSVTRLAWLRQSPLKPNSRHMFEHIERLKTWQALSLPVGIGSKIHQNRLLKIAREGGQMTPTNLAKLEPQRRYATLVALAIEGMATVTDEIIDLHDRIIGKLFAAAKHKHQEKFQSSGRAINDKVRLYGSCGRTPKSVRSELSCFWEGGKLPYWCSLSMFFLFPMQTFRDRRYKYKVVLEIPSCSAIFFTGIVPFV